MNTVTLIGNLTKDPDTGYTQGGTARCTFTVAVSRPKKDGQDQGADYPRIVVWGRQAETCERYLSKGSKVAVQGSIRTGSYKDREGKTVYTTDIWANNVEFLSTQQEPRREARPVAPEEMPPAWEAYDDMDSFSAAEDDLPI